VQLFLSLYDAKNNREALMSTNIVILSDRINRYLFFCNFSYELTAFFYRTHAALIKCSSGLIFSSIILTLKKIYVQFGGTIFAFSSVDCVINKLVANLRVRH
jgi:hypothetical protein